MTHPGRRTLAIMRLPRPLRFAVVGLGAFVLDMSVLALLVYGAHWSAAHARLVSIPAAASAAWLANRYLTFADRRRARAWSEWWRYLAISALNVLVNYGVYRLLVAPGVWGSAHPLLAVTPGALAGLALTYTGAAALVFTSRNPPAAR